MTSGLLTQQCTSATGRRWPTQLRCAVRTLEQFTPTAKDVHDAIPVLKGRHIVHL
jgi:hypothetical protein